MVSFIPEALTREVAGRREPLWPSPFGWDEERERSGDDLATGPDGEGPVYQTDALPFPHQGLLDGMFGSEPELPLDDEAESGVALAHQLGQEELGFPLGCRLPDPEGIDADVERDVGVLSGEFALNVRADPRWPFAIPGRVYLPDRFLLQNRHAAGQYLCDRLVELGLRPRVRLGSRKAWNVYSVLRATSGNEITQWVLVGGHYDSVHDCPGAIDNATGCAIVLAVAAYLSRFRCREFDIVFAFFDLEEQGLVGSESFAANPPLPLELLHSVHTVDQLGWDSDGDRVIQLEGPLQGIEDLYRSSLAVPPGGTAQRYEVVPEIGGDDYSFRADHNPSMPANVAVVQLTEEYQSKAASWFDPFGVAADTTPFYHQPGDTFATVDFGYTRQAARSIAYALGLLVSGGWPGPGGAGENEVPFP